MAAVMHRMTVHFFLFHLRLQSSKASLPERAAPNSAVCGEGGLLPRPNTLGLGGGGGSCLGDEKNAQDREGQGITRHSDALGAVRAQHGAECSGPMKSLNPLCNLMTLVPTSPPFYKKETKAGGGGKLPEVTQVGATRAQVCWSPKPLP